MWSQRARCTKSHIHLCYDRSLSRCRSYSPNRTTFWSETTVRHDDKPDRTDVDFYDAITELYRIRLHSNLSAVPVTSLAALKPTNTTKQKRHKNSDTLKLSRCETGLQASSNFQIRRSVLETSQMIDLKTLNSDLQFFHQRPTTRRVTDKATSKEAKGGLISRREQSASSISVFEGSNNRHLNSEAAKRASSAQEARFSFVPRTSNWNRPAQGHWDFRWTPEQERRFLR